MYFTCAHMEGNHLNLESYTGGYFYTTASHFHIPVILGRGGPGRSLYITCIIEFLCFHNCLHASR